MFLAGLGSTRFADCVTILFDRISKCTKGKDCFFWLGLCYLHMIWFCWHH